MTEDREVRACVFGHSSRPEITAGLLAPEEWPKGAITRVRDARDVLWHWHRSSLSSPASVQVYPNGAKRILHAFVDDVRAADYALRFASTPVSFLGSYTGFLTREKYDFFFSAKSVK